MEKCDFFTWEYVNHHIANDSVDNYDCMNYMVNGAHHIIYNNMSCEKGYTCFKFLSSTVTIFLNKS